MSAGMHDHPGVWPTLPGKEVDELTMARRMAPVKGTPWETLWEYRYTHDMTDREGAAFWTAANLMFEAMGGRK